MTDDHLKFSVDSQLLGELGERLVTKNYVALAELVKNAYDADAKSIALSFAGSRRGGANPNDGRIQLIDDGNGMLFEEVRQHWMRIATAHKGRDPISPIYGRQKTGSKGIGRFACRRLARRLILETTARLPGRDGFETTKVEFDWTDFRPGTILTDIPCHFQSSRLPEGTTGVTLTLTDLSDAWTDSQFDLLRRQLLSLTIAEGTRREGFEEDPGFKILFEAPEFPKGVGNLVEQFMAAGWGKLNGIVRDGGRVDLHLYAKDLGPQQYVLPTRFPRVKGTKFEISWVPVKKEYWRDTSTINKGLTREIMNEQGGIRLYLDGFRVYPYGDPTDDWLSINMDVARRVGSADRILNDVSVALGVDNTRSMLNHPRNENLIGRVNISSTPDSGFEVKLNREGLVQNEASDQLTQALRLSLQWMVLHYNKFMLLFGSRSVEAAEKEFQTAVADSDHYSLAAASERGVSLVQKALEVITAEAQRATQILPEADRRRAENSLVSASKLIHRSFTQSETYLNVLRGVASTGVLMFSFSHEIKNLIGRLETHANSLDRLAEKLSTRDKAEMNEFAQSLRQTRDRLDQQVALFGTLSRKTADTERKMVVIRNICNEVISGFEYLIDEYNMAQPTLDVPHDMRIGPMLEVELYSILVNLVSNAIKANLAGQGKRMLIRALRVDGGIVLRVCDDGMGLPLALQQKVFEPLSADPEGRLYSALRQRVDDEDLAALGRGSGLGLSIVRGIAETYGGRAEFKTPNPPWKTCVEVTLP